MQSPTQENSGPDPVTTATTEQPANTGAEPQPAQSKPDAQETRNNSAAPGEAETVITQQETETGAIFTVTETPATVLGAQETHSEAVESQSEPPEVTAGMEIDSASKPSAHTESVANTNTAPDVQKAKKQDKGVRDGRKYVPSKKAMVDPLKMDMSKPLVIPLTCE